MNRNKLNIGVIVPQFPSYSETFFLSQVTGLCQRGHRVFVFCNSENEDQALKKSFQLSQYSNLQIISLHFKLFNIFTWIKFFFQSLFFIHKMRFYKGSLKNFLFMNLCQVYFEKYKCAIYHFGYSGTAVSYLPIIHSLKGKSIVSCRGTAENVKPLSEPGRGAHLKELFAKIDKVHCVSNSMLETIKRYDAPFQKIFINRPAVDISYFSRKTEFQASEQVRILSIGRLVFQKGFMIGLLAMREFKKMFTNFEWIIVGDGPEDEELLFNINLAGLHPHVKLIGRKTRDQVRELYESTDIFFLPSVSEGIANVVLEAMAMEIPVVASLAGGIREVITDNINGLLCENYDYQAMADALHVLSMDFNKRKCLGKKGRKTIEESFSLDRYIEVFEQQYYELIS